MKLLFIVCLAVILLPFTGPPLTGNSYYDFPDSIIARNRFRTEPELEYMNKLSISGYYHEAAAYEPILWGKRASIALNLKDKKMLDARTFILAEARKYRIIFINESHDRAQHRLFTKSLLKELHQQGYNVFMAEGIRNHNGLDSNRCPVSTDGVFLNEPNYAQLLRYAWKVGFKVHAYEYYAKSYWDDSVKLDKFGSIKYIGYDPPDSLIKIFDEHGLKETYFSDSRENGQASNVLKIIKENPSSKFIIHVGEGHVNEGNSSLAGKVKLLLKEDVLTIDQTYITEQVDVIDSSSMAMIHQPTPYFLKDTIQNTFYQTSNTYTVVDYTMFNAAVKDSLGRPDFLFKDVEHRKVFFLSEDKFKDYPCLFAAYYADERKRFGDKAIAVDLLYIKTRDKQQPPLLLYPGKYAILKKDRNGKFSQFDVDIK